VRCVHCGWRAHKWAVEPNIPTFSPECEGFVDRKARTSTSRDIRVPPLDCSRGALAQSAFDVTHTLFLTAPPEGVYLQFGAAYVQ
jgi:hypothetical protein